MVPSSRSRGSRSGRAEVPGSEVEELRDVAFVGSRGVGRGVAVQPQMFDERRELGSHAPDARAKAPAIQSSRAASARIDVAVLRSSFFKRRPCAEASGGGMMPKVMFVG